jgi:ubiquitin-protein ligase
MNDFCMEIAGMMSGAGHSSSGSGSSAVRALGLEYKGIQDEPIEGFRVRLVNDDNLFDWEVAIFGPPDTLYQGGYFKVGKMT